jgi:8-oxo-dGTP pyrophosphatase MutT (NUDIX family)
MTESEPETGGAAEAPYLTPLAQAATVVLLRERDAVLETVLLRRTQAVGFGGVWVFPGGKLDAADGPAADRHRRAAAREVAEETGIAVSPSGLVPYARWMPPATAARRFDTAFFLASVDDAEVVVDGGEIDDHVWGHPASLMDRHATGSLTLVAPTWVTLHRLARFRTVAEALADARATPVETFCTQLFIGTDGVRVALWHGDVAYESDAAIGDAGGRHRRYMWCGPWRYVRSEQSGFRSARVRPTVVGDDPEGKARENGCATLIGG